MVKKWLETYVLGLSCAYGKGWSGVSIYAIVSAIDTLAKKLKKTRVFANVLLSKTIFVPVILVLTGILLNSLFSIKPAQSQAVFGGPDSSENHLLSAEDESIALLAGDAPEMLTEEGGQTGVGGFFILDKALAYDRSNPFFATIPTNRDKLMIYRVVAGDTLSSIAKKFDIDVDTLFGANKGVTAKIKEGQDIVILPVKGALHTVVSGDTLSGIARKYGVTTKKISELNEIGEKLVVGQKIIVPGAVITGGGSAGSSVASNLPNYSGYYSIPTVGYNWGKLHGHNGVDIANKCGTEVRAAATGVIRSSKIGGYNGGYGGLIVIEHNNGTQTYYAHLQASAVKEGTSIASGQLIGYIGNTGKTTGVTGCHLHFEIRGAKNPFAKY